MTGLGGLQVPRHRVPASFSARMESRTENARIVGGTALLRQLQQQNLFCSG